MAYNLLHDPSSGIGFQSGGSAFGDTTYTKVFVGGLAWETQNESLRQYFEQFGEIVEAVVITDKNTGRSKGYGFVTFGDPEAARRACADPYPIIDGRRANCNLASLGRPQTLLIYGGLSPTSPYAVHVPANFRAYFGSFGYQQPFSCNYKQAYVGPTFGYASFRNAYNSSQGIYNPHFVQQSIPTCGLPGMINTTIYPHEVPVYAMPIPVLQFGLAGTKEITYPSAQASSYPTAVPAQTPFILPATF